MRGTPVAPASGDVMEMTPVVPAVPAPAPADIEQAVAAPASTADTVECAICFNPSSLLESSALRTTTCGHTFCDACLGMYILKRKSEARPPCPMCRSALPGADIPPEAAITLVKPHGALLGVVIGSVKGAVRVVDVAQDSAASAADLRIGLTLLAVEGKPIRHLAHAAELLAASTTRLQLTVGDLIPHGAEAELARARRAIAPQPEQRVATLSNEQRRNLDVGPSGNLFCHSLCCYCILSAQLWQWLMQRPRWHCLLASALLWALVVLGVTLDIMADTLISGFHPNATLSGSFFLGTLPRMVTRDVYHPPVAPESAAMGDAALIGCLILSWLFAATLLKRARDRLWRDEPATAHAVAGHLPEEDTWCFRHPWIGPYLCCIALSLRLHDALVRTGSRTTRLSARYSLFRPLRAPEWELSEWV